jgi:hypothetical protein
MSSDLYNTANVDICRPLGSIFQAVCDSPPPPPPPSSSLHVVGYLTVKEYLYCEVPLRIRIRSDGIILPDPDPYPGTAEPNPDTDSGLI